MDSRPPIRLSRRQWRLAVFLLGFLCFLAFAIGGFAIAMFAHWLFGDYIWLVVVFSVIAGLGTVLYDWWTER